MHVPKMKLGNISTFEKREIIWCSFKTYIPKHHFDKPLRPSGLPHYVIKAIL